MPIICRMNNLPPLSMPSWLSVHFNRHSLREYVAIDVETNGFSATDNDILSIGAVRFLDGEPVAYFYSLSHPYRSSGDTTPIIDIQAQKVNGITANDLLSAPPEESVMKAFANFLGASPVVGHNVIFDYRFIRKALLRHKIRSLLGHEIYDTLALSRQISHRAKSNKLVDLCNHYNINLVNTHNALGDSLATGQLFAVLRSQMPDDDVSAEHRLITGLIRDELVEKHPYAQGEHAKITGKKVARAGLIGSFKNLEAAQIIKNLGGVTLHDTLVGTEVLVTGDFDKETDHHLGNHYQTGGRKLRKVYNIMDEKNRDIDILETDEFITIAQYDNTVALEPQFTLYTIPYVADLSSEWKHINSVIPTTKRKHRNKKIPALTVAPDALMSARIHLVPPLPPISDTVRLQAPVQVATSDLPTGTGHSIEENHLLPLSGTTQPVLPTPPVVLSAESQIANRVTPTPEAVTTQPTRRSMRENAERVTASAAPQAPEPVLALGVNSRQHDPYGWGTPEEYAQLPGSDSRVPVQHDGTYRDPRGYLNTPVQPQQGHVYPQHDTRYQDTPVTQRKASMVLAYVFLVLPFGIIFTSHYVKSIHNVIIAYIVNALFFAALIWTGNTPESNQENGAAALGAISMLAYLAHVIYLAIKIPSLVRKRNHKLGVRN